MSYAYECPLCKKYLRANYIVLHLIKVHNKKFAIFEDKVVTEGILIKVFYHSYNSKHDEPNETFLFKKVKIKKEILKYLGDRMYKQLDSFTKESDK